MSYSNELFSPWIKWNLESWRPVIEGYAPKRYPKNHVIFHQGEVYSSLFIISRGRVRISSFSNDGNEKQLYIAESGAICCESSTILTQPYHSTAVAIVDSEIYEIPLDHLFFVMRNNWQVNYDFITYMARKNLLFSHQVTDLSFGQSLQRISKTLLHLCTQYGITVKEGTKIDVRFTHQDLASMVNATRVTVSRLFNLLTDEEVITRKDGYFVVINMEKLHFFAQSGEME